MDLSIIIVNYNSALVLKQCLSSITAQNSKIDFEIFVIDNNSCDNSVALIQKQFPQVNIIENKRNLGFGTGCNQGIRKAGGEYALILNPDTIVEEQALKGMIDFMNGRQDCGILGPKIIDPDGDVQLSCRRFPSFKNALFNRYSVLTKLFPNNRFSKKYLLSDWDHNKTREIDWVSGACMMIRKSALDKTGLFDQDYFMYCEDVDLCYRMKQFGWKIYYTPGAQIRHYIGGSSQSLKYRSIIEHHKSMFKFYKKHYQKNIVLDCLTFGGVVLRAGTVIVSRWLKGNK